MREQRERSAMDRLWTIGAIIAGAVLLAIHSFWGISTLLLSVKDYSPMHGVMGSPFVGLGNFERFFSSAQAVSILGNTLLIGLLTMMFVLLLVVPVVMGLNRVQKIWLRYTLAGVAFLPLAMTQPMLLYPALSTALLDGGVIRLLISFYQAILVAPYLILILVVLGQMMKIKEGRLLAISALAAVGCGWYAGICGGQMPRQLLLNPLNYQYADTLLTYTYRAGLLQSQYSHSVISIMLAGVIGKIGLLLPLIAIAVLLPSESRQAQEKPSALAYIAIPGLLAALVVFIIGIGGMLFPRIPSVEMTISATIPAGTIPILPSLLQIFAPLFGVLLGFLVAGLLIRGSVAGKVWLVLLVVLVSPVGSYSMGQYLATRAMGGLNTVFPQFDVRTSVLFTGILVGLLCRNVRMRTPARAIFAALASYLLVFMSIFGDPFLPTLYISDRALMPLSALHAQITYSGASPGIALGAVCVIIPLLALAGAMVLMIFATRERVEVSDNNP